MGLEPARRRLAALLRAETIESADIDARLLVCAAAGIDHAGLIRAPETPLGAAADRLSEFAARRLRHEPISRILGKREFWGLSFEVSPAVLDPRPETEGLIGSVLDAVGGRRDAPLTLLDLGTGSGAILAALLRELPAASGIGTDRSYEACRVARRNLAALGVAGRAAIVCAHWADALCRRFDVIVSNPPYIARGALAGLAPDVRDHDPPEALDGGEDGLDAYRTIVPMLAASLRPGGVAAFECGAGQGAVIAAMLRSAGFDAPAVYNDLAGHDRIVMAGS